MQGVGAFGYNWLRTRTESTYSHPNAPKGRSWHSIVARLRRLVGTSGLTRGAFTVRQLCEESGYSRTHIRRAAQALNQKWKRTTPRGAYLITDDQTEEILEWLAHDYWSKSLRLYACAWCTGSRPMPRCLGLCRKCYWRYRYKARKYGLPPSGAAMMVELLRLKSLDCWSKDDAIFLERAAERVERGLALEREQLGAVHGLRRRADEGGTGSGGACARQRD